MVCVFQVSPLKSELLFFFFCSHINQKTQFENPVLEAKKKLSQETAAVQQAAAAPPQGNDSHLHCPLYGLLGEKNGFVRARPNHRGVV